VLAGFEDVALTTARLYGPRDSDEQQGEYILKVAFYSNVGEHYLVLSPVVLSTNSALVLTPIPTPSLQSFVGVNDI
jgi:hypothetical protein